MASRFQTTNCYKESKTVPEMLVTLNKLCTIDSQYSFFEQLDVKHNKQI